MKFELKDGLRAKLSEMVEGWEFEAGILEDKPHYEPMLPTKEKPNNLKTYAGDYVRKQSRTIGELDTSQVFIENQIRIRTDLLREPLENRNSDIMKFTTAFLKMITGSNVSIKRVENLLQAVIRNPILRKEYGENKATTADAKGFDRHLFDTGQMFRAIKVKATKRV